MDGGALNAFRFKITLQEIDPPVWRVIEVPARYTLWDLHVAIQDAMGWKDYHLHLFRFTRKGKGRPIEYGIPDDKGFLDDPPILPDWEHLVMERFAKLGMTAEYVYDFGDDWKHEVAFEAIVARVKGVKYPRCVDGARACPPEDCGGPWGYAELLEVIADRRHPEHRTMMTWLGGKFDPEAFDPRRVKFDSPKLRWRRAFGKTRYSAFYGSPPSGRG